MTLDYDPVPVLESVGYTEREAAFLYLVALHSGYFLRRQYDRFIDRGRGAIAAQFLRKAAALGHLQSIACGQARFVYHLTSKELYTAVGLAASQHRRLKGDARIKSRLMVLDFVLDHLGDSILDSAEAKVSFFTHTLGLSEKAELRFDRIEDPIAEVVEDEVQDHEAAFDLRVTLQSAVLRGSQPDCRIHLFGGEVIDKASLAAGDALEMAERDSFAEELRGDSPAFPLDETPYCRRRK
ncbi:MAG: hypothetical protein ABI072_09240 [Edaphobacter sp.]